MKLLGEVTLVSLYVFSRVLGNCLTPPCPPQELERLESAEASADMPAIYRPHWNYRVEDRPQGGDTAL